MKSIINKVEEIGETYDKETLKMACETFRKSYIKQAVRIVLDDLENVGIRDLDIVDVKVEADNPNDVLKFKEAIRSKPVEELEVSLEDFSNDFVHTGNIWLSEYAIPMIEEELEKRGINVPKRYGRISDETFEDRLRKMTVEELKAKLNEFDEAFDQTGDMWLIDKGIPMIEEELKRRGVGSYRKKSGDDSDETFEDRLRKMTVEELLDKLNELDEAFDQTGDMWIIDKAIPMIEEELEKRGVGGSKKLNRKVYTVSSLDAFKKSTATIKISVESSIYNGVVNTKILEVESGIVKKCSVDNDEIYKAYGVDKFMVEVPEKGRYITLAVDESSAIKSVCEYCYGEELKVESMKNKVNSAIDMGKIKAERLYDVEKNTDKQKSKSNITVEYEIPDNYKSYVDGKKEVEPNWVKPIKSDIRSEYENILMDKFSSSIEKQVIEKVQRVLDDLELPVVVANAVIDNKGNGYFEVEGDDFFGRFLVTSTVKDGIVENVEPHIYGLKCKYGMKEIQVDLGGRIFKTESKDEVGAVVNVLSYLVEQGEELLWDGKKLGTKVDSEIVEKIAQDYTKVIKVYSMPDEVDIGNWKIINKGGKKYFERC